MWQNVTKLRKIRGKRRDHRKKGKLRDKERKEKRGKCFINIGDNKVGRRYMLDISAN